MQIIEFKEGKGSYFSSISSTQEEIKKDSYPPGSWILSKEQTQGKGRNSNTWIGFAEQSIYFSGKCQITISKEISLPIFSLLVANSVFRTLSSLEIDSKFLKMKWPNDLYYREKKVAGILIESNLLEDRLEWILGIGINLFSEKIPEALKEKATVLLEKPIPEEQIPDLVKKLLTQINLSLYGLADETFLQREIQFSFENSLLKARNVEFLHEKKIQQGEVFGYSTKGYLQIKTATGQAIELLDTTPEFRIL